MSVLGRQGSHAPRRTSSRFRRTTGAAVVAALVAAGTVAGAGLARAAGGARAGGDPAPATTTASPGPQGVAVAAGAGVADFTPPAAGRPVDGRPDPADCVAGTPLDSVYSGHRDFAFEEPYQDLQSLGHYAAGDPYVDCNHNGRWDGNLLGGGTNNPRFYQHVADPVTARALAVRSGDRTIAVEVVDQEGLFDVYQAQIRRRAESDLARQGMRLDGAFISATHDESAPDSLGLGGVNPATSGTNDYFVSYLVERSAQAIEDAVRSLRPAHLKLAEAAEPAGLRQCWSSYPYVDDRLMPALQAVAADGSVIATLADVSQHAETLGFNPDTPDHQSEWVSGDWPHFFRSALEARYGGVGIEMAGSVGSVETPEVWSQPVAAVPQSHQSDGHPAGCDTLFDPAGTMTPIGYAGETSALGTGLAQAVVTALDGPDATWSQTGDLWGRRVSVCLPLDNALFTAAGAGGVFAHRPAYSAGCAAEGPVAPNGTTAGNEVLTQVAAFRIGDATFAAVPGEVFPFTYLRGFLGPGDMPDPTYGLPPWPMPHMHTPYRFVDGLAEDMVGYIFPRGNGVGVPGENPIGNPQAGSTDRFGCGHPDDSESATSRAGDILGTALARVLDAGAGRGGPPTPAEPQPTGRYVMPDGTLSRDPLGAPASLGCNADTAFHPAGPAVAVWIPGAATGSSGGTVTTPATWMSLSGRSQPAPDRDTRGWIDAAGTRHWLDVFPDIAGAPAHVAVPAAALARAAGAGVARSPHVATGGPVGAAATAGSQPAAVYRVGAAKADITPTSLAGVYLGGYGIGPVHPATSVLRHIYARAVAVGDGHGHQVVIESLDLQGHFVAYQQGAYGFADIAADVARTLHIVPHDVLIQSTHTHNGPDDLGVWGGVPDAYLAYVKQQAEAAVVAAVRSEAPAVLRWATADMTGFSTTFGPDSDGTHTGDQVDYPVDNRLRVLQAVSAPSGSAPGGSVIATLVNYSTHATVYGPLDKVSPDWPGAAATYLEGDETGVPAGTAYGYPGSVAVVTVGAVGHSWPAATPPSATDPATDPPAGSDNFPADRYGNAVARRAMAALATPRVLTGRARVAGTAGTFGVVNDNPVLLGAEVAPVPGYHIYRSLVPPWGLGDVMVAPAAALRIGDLAFAGSPGEAYPSIERTLGSEVGAALVVPLSLAGDQLGYVEEPGDYPGAMQCSYDDEGFFTISPVFGSQLEQAQRDNFRNLGFTVASPGPLDGTGPVPPATACVTGTPG